MITTKITTIDFKVISPIVTKARPRARVVNSKFAQIYTPKTTVNYENLIKMTYQKETRHYFGENPLIVSITAYFAYPESLKKYSQLGLLCVNHKDLDNIAKTILDALNGVAYKDDKQVQSLHLRKKYTDEGYDYIRVEISNAWGSVEDVKNSYEKNKILNQINKLKEKESLTKKEEERLEELKQKLNNTSTSSDMKKRKAEQ